MKQIIFNKVPIRDVDTNGNIKTYTKTLIQEFCISNQTLSDVFCYLENKSGIPKRYIKIKYNTKTYDYFSLKEKNKDILSCNKPVKLKKIFEDKYDFYSVNIDINCAIDNIIYKKQQNILEQSNNKKYTIKLILYYVSTLSKKNSIKKKYFNMFSKYVDIMDTDTQRRFLELKKNFENISV